MTNTKMEWKKFLTWLRNGFCYVTTWFLFLLLLVSGQREFIEPIMLWYLLIGAAGGVLIFCAVFTKLMIRKLGFTARFTLFIGLIAIYQVLFLYCAMSDYFSRSCWLDDPFAIFSGTIVQWLVFIGIVLAMYGISMAIYAGYRRKYGALYTEALQKYQKSCEE